MKKKRFDGYVLLGWLIKHETYPRVIRVLIYVSGIGGALLMFFGTWYLSAKAGQIDEFFMQYNSIACFPMSVALMLFAKHTDWKKVYRIIPQRIVSEAASAGLGIYVVHMFFLILFERYSFPAYFSMVMPFIIYLLSLGSVLVMKKIPGVRRVIP